MTGKDIVSWVKDYFKLKTNRIAKTMNVNAVHMLKSVRNRICDSFIITTQGGKVIVIDGGYKTETRYFLEYLRKLTGQKKPHIDAWIISHPHRDHIEAFLDIAENFSDGVTVDAVYHSFAPSGFYADTDKSANSLLEQYNHLKDRLVKEECFVKTGDEFSVGDASFAVFNSFDPEYKNCNDSSLMFRMLLGGKTIMFTGDCGEAAGKKVLERQADLSAVKSDICKMAHHGQSGCNKAFYEAVSPEICLWPTPSWVWDNRSGNLRTPEVRRWIAELGVKKNYVSKSGTSVLML